MTPESSASRAGWIVKMLDCGPDRRTALLTQDRITIGHGLHNDVVLRDVRAKGRAVVLDLAAGDARLQVVEGEASLLGRALPAPAAALLPPYTPLSLGGLQVAYGEPDSPRWADAERLARAVRSGFEHATPDPDGAPPSTHERLLRRLRPYLPLALGATAIALALFGAQSGSQSVAHASDLPKRTAAPSSTDAAAMVSRAEDIFMSAGTPATVVIDGKVHATVSVPRSADPMLVDQARRRVLRTMPGLRRVDVLFDPPPRSPLAAGPAAGGQHIVAAVSGPDGYLVAGDGSKYFAGARLPTGQVLKSIDHNEIVFEQDGVTTHLNLQDEGDSK